MILPTIGELNRRAQLYSVSNEPTGKMSLARSRDLIVEVWAKVEVIGGTYYWEMAQIEEKVTHRIWLRYVPRVTRPRDLTHLSEVDCDGARYRVRRITDVNNEHRFVMLECEEVSDASAKSSYSVR